MQMVNDVVRPVDADSVRYEATKVGGDHDPTLPIRCPQYLLLIRRLFSKRSLAMTGLSQAS